jgi:hypothetical protein
MLLGLRLVFCCACLLSWPARAAGAGALDPGEEDARVITRLHILVPAAEKTQLESLRREGNNWQEIARLLVVTRRTGKPLWEAVWLRKAGLTWDEIARKTGISPEELSDQAEELVQTTEGP